MDTITLVTRTPEGACLELRRLMLVVTDGPDAGAELGLEGGPWLVGRAPDADLSLTDLRISREHLRLWREGGGVRVQDLGSRTGTRVNGVAVEGALLVPGHEVILGDTRLELVSLRTQLAAPRHDSPRFEGLLGASAAMREVFGLVEKVAPLALPVLLQGETGTGKEGLARALHRRGESAEGPLVVVDCTLLDDPTHARSELFGHERGAFTGAARAREGAFVRAHGGTLFLDEVGELPAELQAQLLRVLQEGEVRPLGSDRAIRTSTRLVSASHRDLEAGVRQGSFREDLYFRIAGVVLEIPPLRDRAGDVELLSRHFLPEGVELDDGARAALEAYPWPGNVRELGFVIERAAALATGHLVRAPDLRLDASRVAERAAAAASGSPGDDAPTSAAERAAAIPPSTRQRAAEVDAEAIRQALERTGGNRKEAARLLGIGRATLYRKLEKLGLT